MQLQNGHAVAVRPRHQDLAAGDDAVHVVDVARSETLQEVVGLLVTEAIQLAPKLFGMVNHLDPVGGGFRPRLEHPRAGNLGHEGPQGLVREERGVRRNPEAGRSGHPAHGELVTEVAGRRHADARKLQVLAQGRADLDVVLAQGDDPVDAMVARHVAHGVTHELRVEDVHHREELVDKVPGPVVTQRFGLGQHEHPVALSLDLTEESLGV
ncbi:hypothetical protein D3C72_1494530 [compost metagenome]